MARRDAAGVFGRLRRLAGERAPASEARRDETDGDVEVARVGGPERGDPSGASTPARALADRPRRLPEPTVEDQAILEELSEAVSVEANADDDPRKQLGFDHVVWLEEWLESTVGGAAFDGLEEAVAEHPDVVAALHEDREMLFVSAPALHPDDVRALVIGLLAEPHADGGGPTA
jgi:hypothetical protein